MNLFDETPVPGVGLRVWGLGFGVWGSGVGALAWVLVGVISRQGPRFCCFASGFMVQDSGFRVSGFGSRVQVLQFKVQGWWFEDWGVLWRIHEDLGLLDALSGPASA